MTNIKSSFIRRSSLCPPHERSESPNAALVDESNVQKSLTCHPRQRDQETATLQELQKQIAQQRQSLVNAENMVEHWHKRDSHEDATKVIHGFYQGTHADNQLRKK